MKTMQATLQIINFTDEHGPQRLTIMRRGNTYFAVESSALEQEIELTDPYSGEVIGDDDYADAPNYVDVSVS